MFAFTRRPSLCEDVSQPNLTHRNVRLELQPGPQRGIQDVDSSVIGKAPSHATTSAHMLIFPLDVMQFISSDFAQNGSLTFWMTEALRQLTCQLSDSSLVQALKVFLLTSDLRFVRLVFKLPILTAPVLLPCPPPTLARPLQSWMFNNPSLFCKGAC